VPGFFSQNHESKDKYIFCYCLLFLFEKVKVRIDLCINSVFFMYKELRVAINILLTIYIGITPDCGCNSCQGRGKLKWDTTFKYTTEPAIIFYLSIYTIHSFTL
jgi:hypothetical protein